MSDVLDRRIAKALGGESIDVRGLFADRETAVESIAAILHDISRLTQAIDLLHPGEQQPGEGSVDCAIRLLERARTGDPVNNR